MKFGPVPLEDAEGKILGHHIPRKDGGKLFRKGKPLGKAEIEELRRLGRRSVYVAVLEPGDVEEDEAARRVAATARGEHLLASRPNAGRVNLQAGCLGVLRVDVERLLALNEIEGITVATHKTYSVAQPRQTVATVKIIPFAIPESSLVLAETILQGSRPLIGLIPLPSRQVVLILSGSPQTRQRSLDTFQSPLRGRVEALGSWLASVDFVPIDEEIIGEDALVLALQASLEAGAELIVLAGETAIMDRQDIAPRAVERLGGQISVYGAPVDPGNLLMLAYIGSVPVLGAPGCARSLKPNIIDWILPRLLSGERLERADLITLGHGGLLEGVGNGLSWRERLVDR